MDRLNRFSVTLVFRAIFFCTILLTCTVSKPLLAQDQKSDDQKTQEVQPPKPGETEPSMRGGGMMRPAMRPQTNFRPAVNRPVSRTEHLTTRRTTASERATRRTTTRDAGKKASKKASKPAKTGSKVNKPAKTDAKVDKPVKTDTKVDQPVKTDAKVDKPVTTNVHLVGKPDNVAHNPEQKDGSLGRQSDHKPVLVERDGHYFKRGYYAGLDGGVQTWYWYETPLADNDPVIPMLPYVTTCAAGSDDCRVTTRKPSEPDRLTNPDLVIGWWWPFGDIYPPVKHVQRCDMVNTPDHKSIIGDVIVTCVNAANSCDSSCQLVDINGYSTTPPVHAAAAGGGALAGYSCKCQ
jgi:hypothetical protein